MRFKLILSSVKPDITDTIVDAVKASRATGTTIIPARGTGIREAKSFFGLSLDVPADMDIRYVARLLYRASIRRAPVEEHGKIAGMISLSSLILDNGLF